MFRVPGLIEYMHYGELLAGDALDMRGEVALLSRPVVIQGETESYCPKFNGNCGNIATRGLDTFGGHIKVSDLKVLHGSIGQTLTNSLHVLLYIEIDGLDCRAFTTISCTFE